MCKLAITLVVLIYFIRVEIQMRSYYNGLEDFDTKESFPWLGLVKVKQGYNEQDALTGCVLITEKEAVAVADDISKINKFTVRLTTTAMFFPNDTPLIFPVSDYFIHPEFRHDTINTLAVLKLEVKPGVELYGLKPIQLPFSTIHEDHLIFSIGYTDKNQLFEMSVFEMETVEDTICEEFYKKEKINYVFMWPTSHACYKAAKTRDTCVFDSGMALVTNQSGTWTLVGLGTFGPGCSLPARYIEISPYLQWIFDNTNPPGSGRRQLSDWALQSLMRPGDRDVNEHAYNWTSEHLSLNENRDVLIFNRLNDNRIVLRPIQKNVPSTVMYSDCGRMGETLIYRDKGYIQTPDITGKVLYAVDIYEPRMHNFTCIRVTLNCTKRSKITLEMNPDLVNEDIDLYIKKIPIRFRDRTVPPKVLMLKDQHASAKLNRSYHLWFLLTYKDRADIHVEFYGLVHTTLPPHIAQMMTSTTKKMRPVKHYPTHLRLEPGAGVPNRYEFYKRYKFVGLWGEYYKLWRRAFT